VVVEVGIADDARPGPAGSLGRATMTFSVLPRRADTLVVESFRLGSSTLATESSGFDRPVLERIGVGVLDGARGLVEAELDDYVRNSFGALNGGVIATLAEVSAATAAGVAQGAPAVTRQLTIHYLAQGRAGPVRARADVLGTADGTSMCRVEVIDAGAGDRLMAAGTAIATRDGPG